MPGTDKWEAMNARELRAIMLEWPNVMRQATAEWAKTFANNIWKLSGNGRWRPTLKQARIMRRMLRELRSEGDDVCLIED